jgi:DNA ligase-1
MGLLADTNQVRAVEGVDMTKPFKPMLAADISADLDKLRFPCYATPKLDGVRALIFPDGVYSRSMKRIPNKHVQLAFSTNPNFVGLDGELIVGEPTDKDVYRKTNSVVASIDDDTRVQFYVFDRYNRDGVRYEDRVPQVPTHPWMVAVFSDLCTSMEDVVHREEHYLSAGFEGLILRSPEGLYKNGRSTIKEQGMLKLKRFVDSEAEVIGVEEEMHNANEAKVNELGHTARSSHKANLVGKGTMGALVVRDVRTGVEFKIGTGFTAADRAKEWLLGTIVKYKSFPVGVKDKPRHPVFLGIREDFDL